MQPLRYFFPRLFAHLSAFTLLAQLLAPLLVPLTLFGLISGTAQAQSQQQTQQQPQQPRQTRLRVFVGANHGPDLIREIFALYMAQHPGVQVEAEIGGATSELQARYLNMMLSASDSQLDVFLIDIVRPAQYAAAGWLEPLDKYLGSQRDAVIDSYLPAYRNANIIKGQLVALPAFADAQFLYYRKDLLAKYKLAVPTNWNALAAAAKAVQVGERNPKLQGLSIQGKAIESAVCTFLMPYWSQGGSIGVDGKFKLDHPKTEAGLNMWLDLLNRGVLKKNIAEVATDDTRKEFMAGSALFAVNYGYAWNHFQKNPDTKVRDLVGVAAVPSMTGGVSAGCLGGWQWGVSQFSKHKPEAVKLIRWLSSPQVAKLLAIKASNLPVFAPVYTDPEVLAANPFFSAALPAVLGANARPVTPEYRAVSDALRINTSAVLAGAKTPRAAIADIEARFARVNR